MFCNDEHGWDSRVYPLGLGQPVVSEPEDFESPVTTLPMWALASTPDMCASSMDCTRQSTAFSLARSLCCSDKVQHPSSGYQVFSGRVGPGIWQCSAGIDDCDLNLARDCNRHANRKRALPTRATVLQADDNAVDAIGAFVWQSQFCKELLQTNAMLQQHQKGGLRYVPIKMDSWFCKLAHMMGAPGSVAALAASYFQRMLQTNAVLSDLVAADPSFAREHTSFFPKDVCGMRGVHADALQPMQQLLALQHHNIILTTAAGCVSLAYKLLHPRDQQVCSLRGLLRQLLGSDVSPAAVINLEIGCMQRLDYDLGLSCVLTAPAAAHSP